MDVANAFNCCAGHSVVTTLEQEDSLKHMAWATACQLAPKQALESGGHRWGRRDDGATQGNTSASANFCCSWHKWVRKLDATLAASGGLARFGMDDGYCWGKPSVLFPALEVFAVDILEHCNLRLEVTKSECFTWSGQLPDGAPPGLRLAGQVVDGRWEPGWLVYGCPVGSDRYVEHMLDIKVEEVARRAARVCQVLKGESQAIWCVLRLYAAAVWLLALPGPSHTGGQGSCQGGHHTEGGPGGGEGLHHPSGGRQLGLHLPYWAGGGLAEGPLLPGHQLHPPNQVRGSRDQEPGRPESSSLARSPGAGSARLLRREGCVPCWQGCLAQRRTTCTGGGRCWSLA